MTSRMDRKRSKQKRFSPIFVGQRIRECREERGLTRAELSSRIMISECELSRIETGTQEASLETLFRLLSICDMSIAQFFLRDSLLSDKEQRELLAFESRCMCGKILDR